MWDSSSRGFRSFFKKPKRTQTKDPRNVLHLKRTHAELLIHQSMSLLPPIVVQCQVVLNDLSPNGVYVFCTSALPVGQKIQMTLEEPKRFFSRGKILSCQMMILDRKVISQQSYPFRIHVEFEFESETDRDTVRQYCEEIQTTQLKAA